MELGPGREKERGTGKQVGEMDRQGVVEQVVSSLSSREQRGREGATGTASSGPSSTVLGRYREEEEDVFLKNSLAPFSLIANWSSSSLVNLIEALKHFYKFNKNL